MTTQTAIKYIQGFISMSHDDDQVNEAFELAIKALNRCPVLIEDEFFPVTKTIVGFEVSAVRQENEEIERCSKEEADFYSVYAAFKGDTMTLHDCVANLNTEKEAKALVRLLKTTMRNSRPLPDADKFVNGITSWIETHHEVVEALTSHILKADVMGDPMSPVIETRREQQGSGGMYEMAEELTDKFEQLNKGRQWDGEFYDEIAEFIKNELKG